MASLRLHTWATLRPLSQVARQAGGSVIVTLGDSRAFAAVTAGNAREDIDFFPLVCDYREKTEAAGKIPGGFFKREGRPTTKEILTMRVIDRSIRPMFADGYKQEVQVMTHALQYGSPAINHIPNGTNGCGTTITTDQRGVVRPKGSGCDIGAYEVIEHFNYYLPLVFRN